MNSQDTAFFIDDKADISSIHHVLECARDREPFVERRDGSESEVYVLEMTWTREDSPKREAALRISAFGDAPARALGRNREGMQALAVRVLEGALTDEARGDREVHRLAAELREAAVYAARRSHAEDGVLSRTDHCHATAATPWSAAKASRPGPKDDRSVIPTLDDAVLRRLLPDMPKVVLVRDAKTNGRGRSLVTLEGLNGSASFMDLDVIESMRLDDRFGPLEEQDAPQRDPAISA